jgi:dynactin-5
VHIGEKVTINQFAIVKENVKILPNTVIPANMVIASGSVVGGSGGGLGVGGGGEEKWVEGGDLRELVRSIK